MCCHSKWNRSKTPPPPGTYRKWNYFATFQQNDMIYVLPHVLWKSEWDNCVFWGHVSVHSKWPFGSACCDAQLELQYHPRLFSSLCYGISTCTFFNKILCYDKRFFEREKKNVHFQSKTRYRGPHFSRLKVQSTIKGIKRQTGQYTASAPAKCVYKRS